MQNLYALLVSAEAGNVIGQVNKENPHRAQLVF